ncbi:hypothetical protein J6590_096407 [Homalodisca vitripennis]|nr:hypothetical protein J6590_096407 [Homalodisca vitripennis]
MSSNESDINNSTSLKRKRGRKQVEYKCERIKKSRVKNEKYENWKGNVVRPKEHGFDCRCRWKCIPEKIIEGKEAETYAKFIDFNTKNEQDVYLQSLIECKLIERKIRNLVDDESPSKPKSHSFVYALSTSSLRIQVCKLAFLSDHGISSERVKRLCKLLSQGKSPKDLRRKNTPGNTKLGHIIKAIDDYIASFPQKEAHYRPTSVDLTNS